MSTPLEAGTATYVALAVALAVWIGIFAYLWRIDAQARELRRRLDNETRREVAATPTATLRVQRTENREPRTDSPDSRAANYQEETVQR